MEDVQAVLRAVEATPVGNMVVFALYTGARIGEVLGIQWRSIDLERRQATIATALQRLQRQWALVEPKSEKSRRPLQLPGPAVEALRSERRKQLERQLVAGPRWQQRIPDLCFTDELGGPMLGTTVLLHFRNALREAGLEPLKFHHLRHLHGALLLLNGVDIATIRDVLGHSSVALTASTYAGVMPALRQDAADKLERLLARPS